MHDSHLIPFPLEVDLRVLKPMPLAFRRYMSVSDSTQMHGDDLSPVIVRSRRCGRHSEVPRRFLSIGNCASAVFLMGRSPTSWRMNRPLWHKMSVTRPDGGVRS